MKRKVAFLLLAVLVCRLCVFPAALSGTVSGATGEVVPFAAIYFKDLRRGVSADAEGHFLLELPEGKHDCRVSSVGYESLETRVEIWRGDTAIDFSLERRPVALSELVVTADGSEDPAYGMMRRVVANAPYYECVPDSFAAKVYVKGTGKITDTPGMLELSSDFRKEKEKFINRLFVLEKVSEVKFGAPNRWNEHIEAETNTFPKDMSAEVPASIINFYGSELLGSPSPLREGAFTYYKYKLADRFDDGGVVVNKIIVEPRRDVDGLFSGSIYVVDREWCLAAADLSVQYGGMLDMRIIATFNETEPGVWLLCSQAVTSRVDMLGVKMSAAYTLLAEYSFVDVTTSAKLLGNVVSLAGSGRSIASEMRRIEQKADLTNADSYRLSALTARLVEENLVASKRIERRSRFDLTYRMGTYNSSVDTMAGLKDSAYWAAARSVPLNAEELESYRRRQDNKPDSSVAANNEPDWSDAVFDALFGGNSYIHKGKKGWISFGGLWSVLSGYNFVDGYKVGLGIGFGRDFSDFLSVAVEPSVYYNTGRKVVSGSADARLDYAPLRGGCLSMSGGRVSADYNTEHPESAALVALYSALFARNDTKFYDKAFVSLRNEIEIANGTRFMAGVSWERRRSLVNHISQSWFKKAAKPNLPANAEFAALPSSGSEALTANVSVSYTPAAYYFIKNGRKHYLQSRFPTFTLSYTRGIGFKDGTPSYNRIDVKVEQEIGIGIFNKIIYQVRGGAFLDANGLQFPDFKHFSATRFPLTTHRFADSFVLLDSYEYSTADHYAEAGFTWQSPRLLLKFLPFLRKKNFSECLHLRSLAVCHRRPYSELGYSVNVFDLASVGFFTSWQGFDYRSACVSVSLPLR